MWLLHLQGPTRDGFAFLLKGGINEFGHLSVCTPGSIKGYAHALPQFGTMDWRDVMAQGIMNMIDFGMSPFEAVAAPRIMAVSNAIDISNRIRRSVSEELTAAGYDVKRSAQTFPFAALHAIGIVDGLCSGGADPQRDGMAISV